MALSPLDGDQNGWTRGFNAPIPWEEGDFCRDVNAETLMQNLVPLTNVFCIAIQ